MNRVERLKHVTEYALVVYGQSESHLLKVEQEQRNHGFEERAHQTRIILDGKRAGLTREQVVERIIEQVYPNDPDPEPVVFPDIPKPEYVPFFPVSLIKPRTDRAITHPAHSRDVLEKTILEYGFTEAVTLNSDLSIAHGQLRVEVAREMGLATIPAVVLESTQFAYHLITNRLNDLSRWDHSITDLLIHHKGKVPPKNKALLREAGWFTNDVPLHLTAASMTVESWAKQIWFNERSQKTYHSDPAELLWVERTRLELLYVWDRYMEEFAHIAERVRAFDWDFNPNLSRWGTEEEQAELRQAVIEVVELYEPE